MIGNINEIIFDESDKNPEIKSVNLDGYDNVKKNINDIDMDKDNLGLKDNNLNGTNIIKNINISENTFVNNDSKNLSDNNKYLPLMERIKKMDNSLTNLIDNFENEFLKKKLFILNPLNENMIIQVVKIRNEKNNHKESDNKHSASRGCRVYYFYFRQPCNSLHVYHQIYRRQCYLRKRQSVWYQVYG